MLKAQIIGRIGKEPVINIVNGKTVLNFTVAHSEKYKGQDGVQKEKTTWVDCSWFSDRAGQMAQWIHKGDQIYVEGNPDVRQWTSSQGVAGCGMTLRVISVQLLANVRKENEPGAQQGNGLPQQTSQGLPQQNGTLANEIANRPPVNAMPPMDDIGGSDLPF